MADYETLLVDYFERVDAGLPVDPEEIIQANPDHALRLRKFFRNAGKLNRLLTQPDHAESGTLSDVAVSVGKTLGDFRILRQIGRGGMGVVYEAEQTSIGRPVALKVLYAGEALDRDRLARFRNEVRAVAKLSHEHVVPVYSVGEHKGTHYFVMKLIDGTTLANVIKAGQGKPYENSAPELSGSFRSDISARLSSISNLGAERREFLDAATLIATVADAIDHVHQQGIVHRDIKPSNLLIDHNEKIWVTDFGLARLEHDASLTTTGDVLGTAQYMSPEQAVGHQDVDRRADVYSLGVILYQLLTGELPFRGNHRIVLNQVINDEPQLPRTLNSSIPRDLETICLKCLRKKPQQRYQTARSLAEDLRRYLQGEPIEARPTGRLERTLKWCGRHREASATIVVTAIAAVLIVVLSLRSAHTSASLSRDLTESLKTSEKLRHEAEQARKEADRRTAELRRDRYIQDMKLAYEAWKNRDLRRYQGLLNRHLPDGQDTDLRGIEWHFLRRLGQVSSLVIDELSTGLYAIDFAANGELFAVAGADGFARIYDANSYRLVLEFDTGQGEVNQATFDSEGTRLATAGDDGTVCVWDWKNRKRLVSIQAYDGLAFNALFTPDGETLVTCGIEHPIHVWDAASGKRRFSLHGHERRVHQIVLTQDGSRLVSCSDDRTVRIWDLANQQETATLQMGSKILCVVISEDDRFLAAADENGWLRVWNMENTSLRFEEKLLDSIYSIQFVDDGRRVACGDRTGSLHLVDVIDGNVDRSHRPHLDRVFGLHVVPAGDVLISASRDGTLKRSQALYADELFATTDGLYWPTWAYLKGKLIALGHSQTPQGQRRVVCVDPDSFETVHSIPTASIRLPLAVSADRRHFAQVVGQRLSLHRIDDGAEIARWHTETQLSATAISNDGQRVAAIASGQRLYVFDRNKESGIATDWIHRVGRDLAFSPTSDVLAYITDNVVRVVDVESNRDITELVGHSTSVRDVEFSPDGTYLASSSNDRTVRIWDYLSGSVTRLDGHQAGVEQVRFTPDGRTIISADNQRLYFWDRVTRQLYYSHSLIEADSRAIKTIAISPASDRIVVGLDRGETIFVDLSETDRSGKGGDRVTQSSAPFRDVSDSKDE